MTQKHHLSLKVYHGGGRRGKNGTREGVKGSVDDTHEAFLTHLKETNPLHWASWVLGELHGWLSKQTDCTKQLRLELPEKRRELAEAVNLALEDLDGKTVLGISNGKEGRLMRCRAEEKDFILEQIGQFITEGTRYILVNVSKGDDLAVIEQRHNERG